MDSRSVLILISYLWCSMLNLTHAEFCFRKIHGKHPTDPGLSACRGLIKRESFFTREDCCSDRGVAYYSAKVPFGRRGKKYACIPCDTRRVTVPPLSNSLGWSDWGNWTECDVTCGIGTKRRQRICYGTSGSNCQGDNVELQVCSLTAYCPIDGNWGPWKPWSDCSKTCGGGTRQRTRQCNDPSPQHNGLPCPGYKEEQLPCSIAGCPVDGGWSDWSVSECSTTCGSGRVTRTRECNNPSPKNGGKHCLGNSQMKEKCTSKVKCPVDGDWSLWSRWTSCDVTCGEGRRLRTRGCTAPRPRNGGKDCIGNATQVQSCHSFYLCPIDGGWSEWGPWGLCLAKPCSNESGFRKRSRACTNPQPQFRGKHCHGDAVEVMECLNNRNCPENGNWCEWTQYDECRIADTGPFTRRIRECKCPVPSNGGQNCHGEDFQVESCRLSGSGTDSIRESMNMEGSGVNYDDED